MIATTISCKPSLLDISRVSHVIGINDMIVLNVETPEYQSFNQGINAAVLLVTQLDQKTGSKRFCSGVIYHIQGNNFARILSNHHCFAQQDEKTGLASEQLLENACEKTRVYFNAVSGKEGIISKAQCVPETLITNYMADIALFIVAGEIPPQSQTIAITGRDNTISEGKNAYIIHYPLGKEFIYTSRNLGNQRLPAAIITNKNCKILGNFNDDQWKHHPILAISFKHSCDLTKGSSGSPLISQESHELAGLNWGGVKSTVGEKEETNNAAVKPSYVRNFIDNHEMLDDKINSLIEKANRSNSQSTKKSITEIASEKLQAGCSTIGSNRYLSDKSYNYVDKKPSGFRQYSLSVTSSWLLLLLLFLGWPLFGLMLPIKTPMQVKSQTIKTRKK